MSTSEWINKLNQLDPKPVNKNDKGGQTLLACMEHYKVNSLSELTEKQLKTYYELITTIKFLRSMCV